MRHLARYMLTSSEKDSWKKYLNYYTQDDAKRKFNADSAILVPLALKPRDYYQGTFKYVECLFLQKKERGYISIDCFYTDKAKQRLPEYRKAVEQLFRYED